MDNEPVFEVGQTVVSTGGYCNLLTEGKQYVVTKYEPKAYTPHFTWPVYVTVIGDYGRSVTGHAHRFRALKEGE